MTRSLLALILALQTTAPSTSSTDHPEIRRTVAALRDELVRLTIENAALRKALDEARREVARLSGKEQATGISGKIHVGMTLEEVNKLVTVNGEMISDDGTTRRYRWSVPRNLDIIDSWKPNPKAVSVVPMIGEFVDGTLKRYQVMGD